MCPCCGHHVLSGELATPTFLANRSHFHGGGCHRCYRQLFEINNLYRTWGSKNWRNGLSFNFECLLQCLAEFDSSSTCFFRCHHLGQPSGAGRCHHWHSVYVVTTWTFATQLLAAGISNYLFWVLHRKTEQKVPAETKRFKVGKTLGSFPVCNWTAWLNFSCIMYITFDDTPKSWQNASKYKVGRYFLSGCASM